MPDRTNFQKVPFRLPPQIYLWIAVLIFGASNSITRKLTQIGEQHWINGHNPISFCNVLLVGNLCALLVFSLIYGHQLKRSRQLSRQDWIALTLVSVLSGAIAPGLIFQALSFTSVNTVILIGRLEPPLVLLFSVWWLKMRVNRWEVLGAIVSFFGVFLTIVLQPNGLQIAGQSGLGESFVAIAALCLAISTVISKSQLTRVPIGIFSVYRTGLSTIVFYAIASIAYGQDHFIDAFSPILWQWMLLYGSVIVVLGQLSWMRGLARSRLADAAIAGSFAPIAGIAAAFWILDEIPTTAQVIGGCVILAGVFSSQIGIWSQNDRQTVSATLPIVQPLDDSMGFKGI